MPENPRIGWIGTGVMGLSMAGHLLDAGYRLDVFNRTESRAAPLIERGARWHDSPAAVAAEAGAVFTMVGYPADVREVLLGDGGVVAALAPGSLLVDLTTSEPSLAVEVAEAAAQRDVDALDAPVSGGDVGAREARLTVMAGGSDAAFERAKPLMEPYSRTIAHVGGPGAGQHVKMVNQIAIASGMIGVCEALVYAARSGLDPELALKTIEGGAAGSWSLTNYGPRQLAGDFEPGFKVDHFVKDLGIALAEARRMGLDLPGTALAEELYRRAQEQNLGQKGTQSLLLVIARMSDVDWPSA